MTDMHDLTGRTALVTGASQGLGHRFARVLARHGAAVGLAARQVERIAALESEIAAGGGRALAVPMDVLDLSSIEAGVSAVEKTLGPVDILVNNAGLAINRLFLDVSEDEYDTVLGTNLKGCFFCAQVVARSMAARGGGSIINISSVLGTRPIGTLSTYCASKGGLDQLTAAMGLELARHGVRVNAIAPGYVETPMNSDFFRSPPGQALVNSVPQRRLGQVADLDGVLLLLASDASGFMTGSVVTVDGGFAIR